MAAGARSWIAPFRSAFLTCACGSSRSSPRPTRSPGGSSARARTAANGRGQVATGRRFERVDEVYFFTIDQGRIADAWGLEDNQRRFAQLGFTG
jgi:hypothetical protein